MMLPAQPDNHRLCIIGEADPFLARLLKRFAEKHGLRSRVARTGEAALDLARRERPALLIIDPELPGRLRGWEASRALHAEPCDGLAIILCAWMNKEDAAALAGPALAHLQKPELHYVDFAAALAAAGIPTGGPV